MQNSLRLGVFRDRSVFEQELPPESPLVIPAHIAAYAMDGLRGFLAGIAKARGDDYVDYIFDPMTYWVDLPSQYWSRGSERGRGLALHLPLEADANPKKLVRPTLLALLRIYGLGQALFDSDLPGMRRRLIDGSVKRCLEFQRRGSLTLRAQSTSKYARILQLAEEQDAMEPMAVVAPYLTLTGLDVASIADQALLNDRALEERMADEPMWTVVALDAKTTVGALDPAARTRLRLDEFDVVGVWVSDLDEYVEGPERLRAYRNLIRSIGRPVWLMFGGYFGLLLGPDGVINVSHGIYYTESKRMRGPIGSGPPPERYYIPALHRFYEPTRAFRLLELVPALLCDCADCPSVEELRVEAASAASTPARRMAWAQRLQRHFLRARAREVAAVNTRSPALLMSELADALRELTSLSDAERAALNIQVGHLDAWRQALEQG